MGADRQRPDPILESIAKSAPYSMMLLDRDAHIRFINRTAPGLTIEQVIGTKPFDYISEADGVTMRACLDHVASTREVGSYSVSYTLPDGTTSFWESQVSPVLEDDEVTGFVVFASDVTAKRSLEAEQQRFFEMAVDSILIANFDGFIVRHSPSMAALLARSSDELKGAPLFELVHPADRTRMREAHQRLVDGERVEIECRFDVAGGDPVLMHWRASADLEQRRIYAVARNVTVQRAMEDQLREKQKIEAVGQLAGGVAHDFNNLLQAIQLSIEAVALETSGNEKACTYLTDIDRAAQRAADLTTQLLAFSRRTPLTKLSIDINDSIRGSMKMLRRLIPASVEFDFVAGHMLPRISADPTQLEQVLLNLFVNARDAMPDGGRIAVETENVVVDSHYVETHPMAKLGRYVLVTVTDTGHGISPEIKDRIFEPFFTTKARGSGTGLGLSTIYGIVQQHEGYIHVYSEPDTGSSFKIYLPVSERSAAEVGTKLERVPRGDREVILLAEDEELVRNAVTDMLERAGYDVVSNSDGHGALRRLREHPERFSLVILDMVMPGLSGPETYARIRELHDSIPVIFASGYHDSSQFKGRVPPGTRVLRKPFKSKALLKRVRAVLEEE